MKELATLALFTVLIAGGFALVYWFLREIADLIDMLMEDPE